MTAQEQLMQLHDECVMAVSRYEYDHAESIKKNAELTTDIAVKFAKWYADLDFAITWINESSDKELFDYFITNIYGK